MSLSLASATMLWARKQSWASRTWSTVNGTRSIAPFAQEGMTSHPDSSTLERQSASESASCFLNCRWFDDLRWSSCSFRAWHRRHVHRIRGNILLWNSLIHISRTCKNNDVKIFKATLQNLDDLMVWMLWCVRTSWITMLSQPEELIESIEKKPCCKNTMLAKGGKREFIIIYYNSCNWFSFNERIPCVAICSTLKP